MTMSHIRANAQSNESVKLCNFYEDFDSGGRDSTLPLGVYDLDDLKGGSYDRVDSKWMVIRGLLRGCNDTPCGRTTPGRP
jgi:hypothetical protein